MVLLKDIKGWFEANTGKSRKSYYDCYKAAQIKIEKIIYAYISSTDKTNT